MPEAAVLPAPPEEVEAETVASARPATTSTLGVRLEFLDALRGIAASMVVIEHVLELLYPRFAAFTLERFRFGEFGVVVFFLCSGFIIPASLERRGSLRDFWIGRFFRLYPMYWVTIAAVVFLHFGVHRYRGLGPDYWSHWLRNTTINLSIVQDFTGQPLTLGQSWTLAYEMVFYITVSVLFIAGVHKRTAHFAALGLLLSAVVGNHLRTNPLNNNPGPRTLGVLALAVGIGVIATWALTRQVSAMARLGSILCAALVLTALVNRYEPTFQAAFFLGTMFFGTAVYRWTRGQLSERTLALLGIGVVLAVILAQMRDWSPWLHSVPITNYRFHQAEVLTYLGAYALFMTAVLFRHLTFPRWLTGLGVISYSLYLVHPLVIYSAPLWHNRPTVAAFDFVATVLLSTITYRMVEKPGIRLGRRFNRHRARSSVAATATPDRTDRRLLDGGSAARSSVVD